MRLTRRDLIAREIRYCLSPDDGLPLTLIGDRTDAAIAALDEIVNALYPFTVPDITAAQRNSGYVSWRVPVEWIDDAKKALRDEQETNR